MNKNIRLVFEKWDGDKPLPNCSEFFGSDGFRYEDGFFDFYERFYHSLGKYGRHSLPRTFHKIQEVYNNKDLNYYFFIKTSLSINEMFKERKLSFSEEVLNCLRSCNNFTIVFLTEHESDDELGYVELKDYITKNGLNDNHFMLLNNNGNFQMYNLKHNGNIQFNQLQLIPITSNSIFSDFKPPLITEKTGKLFICHNKSSKPHRYATLALLHKRGLIDDVNWSLVTGQIRPPEDYVWLNEALPIDVVNSCENEITMESGGLLIPEDSFSYMNSYVNIVTESQFRDDFNVIHISEKSFRPFAYYNLPLIVATQNHIKYMKDKYGFDFYDDLINHDYDNEKYIGNRITMLIDEVIRLKNNKEDVIKFYKQNTHRLINNQKIISEIKNNNDDYEFFKTIMS